METEIVVTKRFRKNTLSVYEYLLLKHSAKTALEFLDKTEKRIEFISRHPSAGKPSLKRKNIRSIILVPHNRLYYRVSDTKIEILCLFDMRRNPKKKPY